MVMKTCSYCGADHISPHCPICGTVDAMRDILLEDLMRFVIAGEEFQKADWCKSEVKGCFINNHGTVVKFCDCFVYQYNKFKCDERNR
ncbi:MAG TPA: hypothetical protein DCR39_05935 [Nitrospiraceae bacterium]|nr:hypothetical protein [Nitrospiraceae bacterium]